MTVTMMTVMSDGRIGLIDETHVMRMRTRGEDARRSARGRRKGGPQDDTVTRTRNRTDSSITPRTHATACRTGPTAIGSGKGKLFP